MKLFEDKQRYNNYPGGYSGGNYSFLDHSNSYVENNVRLLLNNWFEKYPKEYKGKLSGRLQSEEFITTFFELYLFGLFNTAGIPLIPIYANDNRIPDFLTDKENGFFIEATTSADEHYLNIGHHRVKNELFDYLNTSINDSEFFIHINLLNISNVNPSYRIIRRKIIDWLNIIKKEESVSQYSEITNNKLLIKEKGWTLLITASRNNNIIGNQKRIIGSISQGFEFDFSKDKLRKKIRKKANLYQTLDKPFLLAINMLTFNCDLMDIINAVFGDTYLVIPKEKFGPPIAKRKENGAWFQSGKYRNQRVSALLIIKHLNPWSIANQDIIVIHHPKPNYPIDLSMIPFKQKYFDNGVFVDLDGKHPREILNLYNGWPE